MAACLLRCSPLPLLPYPHTFEGLILVQVWGALDGLEDFGLVLEE